MTNSYGSDLDISDQLVGLAIEGKVDFQRTDLKGEVSMDLLLSFLLTDLHNDRLGKNISVLKDIIDVDEYMKGFSFLTQARIYFAQGKNYQAESLYLDMIQNKEEGFTQAYFALIDMYLEVEDYANAIELYNEACALGENTHDQELHTNIKVYTRKINIIKPSHTEDYGKTPSSTSYNIA